MIRYIESIMDKETPKSPQPSHTRPDESLSDEIINGKYRLKKAIARGGMGVIYAAEQLNLGREVAIKLILQQTDEHMEQRFFQEASLASRIDHPNVIRVYDFGKDQHNRMFLVMELLQGHTLQQYIQQKGALTIPEITDLGIQLTEALVAIHSAGMVHRDIKPANIFLIETPGKRICSRLIDFGLVKDLNNDNKVKTQTGFVLGSPMYMSTEQIRSEPVDGRSDIYSLGLSLYFGVSGKPPYSSDNIAAMLHNQLVSTPQPLDVVYPEQSIPPLLQWILDTSYSKAPENRFANAEQMLFAFQSLSQGLINGSFAKLKITQKGLLFADGKPALLNQKPQSGNTYHLPGPSLNTNKTQLGIKSNGTILLHEFDETQPEKIRQKTKRVLVVLCVAAALIVTALLYISRQQDSAEPTRETQNAAEPSQAIVQSHQLTTIPTQVEVYKDGTQMGLTPWKYVLRDSQELTVTLQKEGYISQQIKLTPTNPDPTIKLKPIANEEPEKPSETQAPNQPTPQNQAKTAKPPPKPKPKEENKEEAETMPKKSDLKDPWKEQ